MTYPLFSEPDRLVEPQLTSDSTTWPKRFDTSSRSEPLTAGDRGDDDGGGDGGDDGDGPRRQPAPVTPGVQQS